MRTRKKETLTLAEYRKRKRNRKSVTGLAAAVAAMAICASRMASAFGRMGSAALKVGGFYNPNPKSENLAYNEAIIDAKAYIDRMTDPCHGVTINAPLMDLLGAKIKSSEP